MKLRSVMQNADLVPCGCVLLVLAVVVWFLFYGVAPWLLHRTAG